MRSQSDRHASDLAAVESDTLVLARLVTDLDDFVSNPDRYLVSICGDPDRATRAWLEQVRSQGYGGEGLIRLSHYGVDLIPADLWDHSAVIWQYIIEVVRQFVDTGRGEAFFPGQPIRFGLENVRGGALWFIGSDGRLARQIVEKRTFLPGVLREASRFLAWELEHIGTAPLSLITQTDELLERLTLEGIDSAQERLGGR